MPDPIANLAIACRTIARDLEHETLRLNAALDVAERKLQHLALNVSAAVPLPSGAELHFRKANDGWGLFVIHAQTVDFVEWKAASRRARVEIGHALPALLEQMRDIAAAQCGAVAAAADRAERWAQELPDA